MGSRIFFWFAKPLSASYFLRRLSISSLIRRLSSCNEGSSNVEIRSAIHGHCHLVPNSLLFLKMLRPLNSTLMCNFKHIISAFGKTWFGQWRKEGFSRSDLEFVFVAMLGAPLSFKLAFLFESLHPTAGSIPTVLQRPTSLHRCGENIIFSCISNVYSLMSQLSNLRWIPKSVSKGSIPMILSYIYRLPSISKQCPSIGEISSH